MAVKKRNFILAAALLSTLMMIWVDGVLCPPYLWKSVIKMVLFLLLPLAYFLIWKEERTGLKRLFRIRKRETGRAVLLGGGVYLLILAAYFLLSGSIDFSAIAESLQNSAGVDRENFAFVAVYISFVNSLLEELLFRGFAFLTLKEQAGRKTAYFVSASAFALYHAGMLGGWFGPALYLLAMLGLFAGGCVFNRLDEGCGNLWPSWLVHMGANFAINTVGCMMFGLV